MEKQYEAIIVLSGKDERTNYLRIEKALELCKSSERAKFVLNGFPKDYEINSSSINTYILEAKNTEENAYATKKFCRKHRIESIAVVSSETHLPRVKQIFHKFFKNYQDIEFISVKEPTERLRKRMVVKELLERIATSAELLGLKRGNGPGTDWRIYQIVDYRKSKLDKFNDLAKKLIFR